VDVAGVVGRQEHREPGDVVDLTPPLERDRLGEDLVEVLVVEQLAGERGLRVGRADPVDADPVLAVLDREGPGPPW
jgi:hypothetical protein